MPRLTTLRGLKPNYEVRLSTLVRTHSLSNASSQFPTTVLWQPVTSDVLKLFIHSRHPFNRAACNADAV